MVSKRTTTETSPSSSLRHEGAKVKGTALTMVARLFGRSFPPRCRPLRLFIFCLIAVVASPVFYALAAPGGKKPRVQSDERVYLLHSDRLHYDQFGRLPDAQILNGNVRFRHKGAYLTCDSAHFYEANNSFEAFGHVHMTQGDTLELTSGYAYYDGNDQMAYARYDVVLRHIETRLYTDSLDYDRLYELGYYYEGGKMVDGDNVLTSDWGQYDTQTREAVFYYSVRLDNPKFILDSDTLYYYSHTSIAHVVGPSVVTSGSNVIHTTDGYYNTDTGYATLYERSTVANEGRHITGDSLFYDEKQAICEGYGNVFYDDKNNKNGLTGDYVFYNDSTGYAYSTIRAVAIDYSQGDTLYMHGDTIKMFTFNMDTDSVWRRIHCYNHVRAYRTDMQAVCDSLVYTSLDSCMTMYKDPITWYGERQLLGEVIRVYLKDSTINLAHVHGQAFSIEKADEHNHYNQISSRDMYAYFKDGEVDMGEAIGNVLAIYYPVDDKDSSLIGHVYVETDTIRMFVRNKTLYKIWMPEAVGVMYPVTQIPTEKRRLPGFVLFDYVRPVDKNDIFNWRGKAAGTELKVIKRSAAPLQVIKGGVVESVAMDFDENSKSQLPPNANAGMRKAKQPEPADTTMAKAIADSLMLPSDSLAPAAVPAMPADSIGKPPVEPSATPAAISPAEPSEPTDTPSEPSATPAATLPAEPSEPADTPASLAEVPDSI